MSEESWVCEVSYADDTADFIALDSYAASASLLRSLCDSMRFERGILSVRLIGPDGWCIFDSMCRGPLEPPVAGGLPPAGFYKVVCDEVGGVLQSPSYVPASRLSRVARAVAELIPASLRPGAGGVIPQSLPGLSNDSVSIRGHSI